MAILELATLCTGVSYDDGLAQITNAGVDTYTVELPSNVELLLAVWLRAEGQDYDRPIAAQGSVALAGLGGEETVATWNETFRFSFTDGVPEPVLMPHHFIQVQLAYPASSPGVYSTRVEVDGAELIRLPFIVKDRPKA